MKNLTLVIGLLFLGAGCAMKTKILDVNALSVSQTSIPPKARLVAKGPVTGQFCADALHDRGTVGLLDEAVKDAQNANDVDFLTNVTVWRTSNGCIQVEGIGQKLMASDDSRPASIQSKSR